MSSKTQSPLGNGRQASQVEIYNSDPNQPSTPTAPSNTGNSPQPNPGTSPQPKPPLGDQPPPDDRAPPSGVSPSVEHRFLSPTEWARFAHGVGAIRDGEEHQVVHPTCWYWPTKGLPDGLYRDVVHQRTKYSIGFQVVSTLFWSLMTLQVMIGAVITALGSQSTRHRAAMTILAAVSTVCAGLVALLHNTGLPDRYRMDKAEFVKVEDYIRAILDTGVVEAQQKVEDVLEECFARFQNARIVVLSNKPEVYNASLPSGNVNAMLCPEPAVHLRSERK